MTSFELLDHDVPEAEAVKCSDQSSQVSPPPRPVGIVFLARLSKGQAHSYCGSSTLLHVA